MSTPTETPLCCGEHYPGEQDKPIVGACQLCPKSHTYWRSEPKA